jgi:predicted DNA-binding protein (UPF0278 family)
MDPNATLNELREWYNAVVQDGTSDHEGLIEVLTLFDELDNWIVSGGFLPRDWAPRHVA